jgi:hypothetical protein
MGEIVRHSRSKDLCKKTKGKQNLFFWEFKVVYSFSKYNQEGHTPS